MKRNCGSRMLPVMVLSGIAALVLRKGLYAVAVDVKGLLVRNHPLEIVLTVLSAAVLAAVVLGVRKIAGSGVDAEHDSAGLPAAFGNAAAGAGILITVLTGRPETVGYLGDLWRILGLAAPVCLLLAALARGLGKKPFFLLYVTVCLYFALHIVTRYQLWSGNPQLQDYVFSLLAAMALMFFGFCTAAQAVGCGNFPIWLGTGLAAVYLCLAELARSSCPWLYLGCVIWVLTELAGIRENCGNKKI